MKYLKKAANKCLLPSAIVLGIQLGKMDENGTICTLLLSMGIAYMSIVYLYAFIYWYIEKRFGKKGEK